MTTTSTDKPVVDLTTRDRPTHVADAPHLDQPVRRRPHTTTHRAFVGLAAAIVALVAAAVLAVALSGRDASDPSVNRVADNPPQIQESTQAEAVQTELDVRGVPTWWARAEWPVERDDARDQPQAVQTELVNGVPTWWARAEWPVERDDATD